MMSTADVISPVGTRSVRARSLPVPAGMIPTGVVDPEAASRMTDGPVAADRHQRLHRIVGDRAGGEALGVGEVGAGQDLDVYASLLQQSFGFGGDCQAGALACRRIGEDRHRADRHEDQFARVAHTGGVEHVLDGAQGVDAKFADLGQATGGGRGRRRGDG